MKTISPKDLNNVQLQTLLQTAIAPRPIALASTIDKDGNVNLSPFSFFNMFSTNPPVVIFSERPSPDEARRFMELGARDCWVEPLTFEKISAAMPAP